MRGRKAGQLDSRVVKEHDASSVEDVIRTGHMQAMQNRGEIAIFDAGKYFASMGDQGSRVEEMEEELDDDADAEVGGDLPLSPLPEFYSTSKAKHHTGKDQWRQGDKAHAYTGAHVQNVPATKTTGGAGRDGAYSEPQVSSANIANSTSNLAPQSNSSNAKPQPFSPSARLASFFARFKLSSESKSKPSAQYSNATPPTPLVPSPKSFFSNAAALPANGKLPSPRGRFLRALSSSSSHTNPLLKPISHMHHQGPIATSTPVSPAGSDPYSPITHSASTTPTSRKNPRSRSRSHVPHLEGTSPGFRPSLPTTDWRHDLDNSSSRSLSTHLPFLRRKLKAYLMPEKSPRHHSENHHQLMNRQLEKVNIHHVSNGADRHRHIDKPSTTPVSSKLQVAASSRVSEAHADNRQLRTYKVNAASMDKARAAGHSSSAAQTLAAQADQHHQKSHHNTMQSPVRWGAEPLTTKETSQRRAGGWRRHAEEREDDIEVAERLLRVVKEHQLSKTYATSSYKGASNYRQQSKGYANYQADGTQEMNGSSSRKGRKSLVSPASSPAANFHSKQANSKEEFACPYDSDSSSDLFEIETFQAFSHVAGLYRPRDLPAYDSINPLKSPLHLK